MQDGYHRPEHLYFLPAGGTAMAPLACLLAEEGHRIEGVDATLYPPMSTLLTDCGVDVRLGWDPAAIPATADRVVIGNAVPRTNPEVVEVLRRRQPHLAQAEAVAHYVLAPGRRAAVVAGTHGKTTTSAVLAWILEAAGADPTYLVGGLLRWSQRAHRCGRGAWAVLEGDEYNTAFFDRGPKFLHYRPEVFLLGPVEFDHADLYRDLDAVVTAFRAGSALVPRHGAVVVNGWCDTARRVAATATAPVRVAGEGPDADARLLWTRPAGAGTALALELAGRRVEAVLPLAGRHNAHNATLAAAAALEIGVPADAIADALNAFPGVARRLEVVGERAGVLVVDDFAHHPTAVAAVVAAVRDRWPDRRVVLVFEPRSLSAARAEFQAGYVEAMAGADLVFVATPYHVDRIDPELLLDPDEVAHRLRAAGTPATALAATADPVAQIRPQLVAGDVVVACSSGDFGGFHHNLLAALPDGTTGP